MTQDETEQTATSERPDAAAENSHIAGERSPQNRSEGGAEGASNTDAKKLDESKPDERVAFSGLTFDQIRELARQGAEKLKALPAKLTREEIAQAALEAVTNEIEDAMKRGYTLAEAIHACGLTEKFGIAHYFFVQNWHRIKERNTPEEKRARGRVKRTVRRKG